MAMGFDPKKGKNKSENKSENRGRSLEDKYGLDLDDRSSPSGNNGRAGAGSTTRPNRVNRNAESSEDNEEYNRPSRPNPKNRRPIPGNVPKEQNVFKALFFFALAVMVALGFSTFYIYTRLNSANQDLAKQKENTTKQIESVKKQLMTEEDNQVTAGIPNLYTDTTNKNESKPVSGDLVVKNLNGKEEEPNYEITKITDIKDFVNYKKFRAVTGTGLEFYWLECNYKGRNAKVQVPFTIFKELDKEGITAVNMEVLTLKDGSQIISYMSVLEDAKQALDRGGTR